MMPKTLLQLLSILVATYACAAAAQYVAVPPIESGLLYSGKPTIISIKESPKARAVLVSIPGGHGQLGFKLDSPVPGPTYDPPSSYAKIMRRLSDPEHSTAVFHVVIFDSPYVLPLDTSNRRSPDHIMRIESVVQYARDRFKLPVWVMGHSNGGVSIAEFHKQMVKKNKPELVAGMIMSAPRNVTDLETPADIPALFISAERDGCQNTLPDHNKKLAERFKSLNKGVTEFAGVQGGEAQGDPCHSGVHMYHTAHEEVVKIIDAFATRNLSPQTK